MEQGNMWIECAVFRAFPFIPPRHEYMPPLLAKAGKGFGEAFAGAPLAAPRIPRRRAGFTLIEILVVVAIIGILAAVATPKIMGRADDARKTAARHEIGVITASLKMYKLDNFAYPTQSQGLASLVEKPTVDPIPRNWKEGGYLDFPPRDPWGNNYVYLNPGKRGEIDIYSLGPDGQPGDATADDDVWAAGK